MKWKLSRSAHAKSGELPGASVRHLRALAHDLSNSLETVLQAAYLLKHSASPEQNQRWTEMIEDAAQRAAHINQELRAVLGRQAGLPAAESKELPATVADALGKPSRAKPAVPQAEPEA